MGSAAHIPGVGEGVDDLQSMPVFGQRIAADLNGSGRNAGAVAWSRTAMATPPRHRQISTMNRPPGSPELLWLIAFARSSAATCKALSQAELSASRQPGGRGGGMAAPDLSRAIWRKSSRSNGAGGECVEVAATDRVIAVRDSKNPDGPKLVIPAPAWRSFTAAIKIGSISS